MALDPMTLSKRLGEIFAAQLPSKEEAAEEIAKAYYAYAQLGQFGASLPVLLPAHRDAMAATLSAAFAVPGLPPIGANAFGSALSVFWAAVPIVGAQSGSTTGCPGASSVPAQLIPIFLDFAATAEKSGQAMGAALHSATLTVTTALAPPPALVPIT